MNDFKNSVIFVLSVIILIQSAFLIHFLRQKSGRPKVSVKQPRGAPVPKKPAQKELLPVFKPAPETVVGKIVLVLDDWGYNVKHKAFVTDNDFHVTMSILPFRAYSIVIAQLAAQHQKDVIVHMPMEPQEKEKYGLEENTLLTSMDKAEIIKRLEAAFRTVPFALGMSNHMGSKATQDTRLMRIVFDYLKAKHLFFLDSFVTSRTVCRVLSKKVGIGFTQRDVFIDNESDPNYIRSQMMKLADKAKKNGVAVGIGHDKPDTIAVLNEMIPRLRALGYKFVNLSEIIESE